MVELVCDYQECGRRFERPAYQYRGEQKKNPGALSFCTRRHAALVRGQKIESRTEWLTLECDYCHQPFRRQAKSQRALQKKGAKGTNCSAACRIAAYTEFARSEEGRKVMSQRAIEFLSSGRMPVVSSVELAVAEVLDRLEVEYEAQAAIRNPANGQFFACVDFLLGDGSVLEVYGTYWHSDPRFYRPERRNARQRDIFQRDQYKQGLFRTLGVPFAIVWEEDVSRDAEQAVRQALEALSYRL